MRHPSKSPIMRDIRMAYGDADEWGTTQMWWFAIADVLHHHAPGTIPAAWEYRHAPGCKRVDVGEYPDCDVALSLTCGDVDAYDLVYAGNVLARYSHWLRLAGKDY